MVSCARCGRGPSPARPFARWIEQGMDPTRHRGMALVCANTMECHRRIDDDVNPAQMIGGKRILKLVPDRDGDGFVLQLEFGLDVHARMVPGVRELNWWVEPAAVHSVVTGGLYQRA